MIVVVTHCGVIQALSGRDVGNCDVVKLQLAVPDARGKPAKDGKEPGDGWDVVACKRRKCLYDGVAWGPQSPSSPGF